MLWHDATLRWQLLAGVALVVACAGAAAHSSFRYEDGQAVPDSPASFRYHKVSLEPLAGQVHAYASLGANPANPVPYGGDQPRGCQYVELGEEEGGQFRPAVRFGVDDTRGLHVRDWGFMHTFLRSGAQDYHGLWTRPQTPYDFRAHLDLTAQRMTVWCAGRGDDRWYLMAANAPLLNPVKRVNAARVEQDPGAPGVEDLVVAADPWPQGEGLRPHPLAKRDRVVGPGQGFRFQTMRSPWGLADQQVEVARQPRFHHGFPDVVLAGPDHLIATWRNGSHSGGTGGMSVAHSRDAGKTWGAPTLVYPGGSNCPRLQKLRDGTLLLLTDVYTDDSSYPVVMYDSTDGGQTWTNERWLRPLTAGGHSACVPSRVAELPDGSWLVVGSWYPGMKPWEGSEGEQLEFYRSTDRGQTWQFWSHLQPYPPHSVSEASVLVLGDGRLMLYARENRGGPYPALKAFSQDHGKTWQVQELPFGITGRTAAGFLPDGRVVLTFRSFIGAAALWAFVGDPLDKAQFVTAGAHLNDRDTVGLKRGVLHLDNDGVQGQFTRYLLRQPDSAQTAVDVTVEVKVLANQGRSATLEVPYVGQFRLYPDRIELAHEPSVQVKVKPGEFHTYRVVRRVSGVRLYVDGALSATIERPDTRLGSVPWTPAKPSIYLLAFGNEPTGEPDATSILFPREISPAVTGYSLWRRAQVRQHDPRTGSYACEWVAARDGFPDQYQLDNIVEVDRVADGWDEGYSGWDVLPDGRVFVVNYTDDGAATVGGGGGIPWIRGIFLMPSDLPPR